MMNNMREEIESVIRRNHPEVGGWVAPSVPKLTVLTQAGFYHCGECGQSLRFEPTKLSESNPEGIGHCSNEAAYSNITGELIRKGCSRANVKMKVPLSVLYCDVVE
jgi:hypothetical protein